MRIRGRASLRMAVVEQGYGSRREATLSKLLHIPWTSKQNLTKSLKSLAKAKDVPACLMAVVCYNAMHMSVCWESCLPASACAFQTSPQQKAILKMSFGMEACIPKHTKSGHEQYPKATGWPYQVYCSGPNSAGDVPHPKEPHLHCQGM